MMMLTKKDRHFLTENGKASAIACQRDGNTPDHKPVVKFFSPWGAMTWLFTELADDGDTLFGLCDLGFGEPELGNASLEEITSVKGPMGLKIERDRWFQAGDKTLSAFTEEARRERRIMA